MDEQMKNHHLLGWNVSYVESSYEGKYSGSAVLQVRSAHHPGLTLFKGQLGRARPIGKNWFGGSQTTSLQVDDVSTGLRLDSVAVDCARVLALIRALSLHSQ